LNSTARRVFEAAATPTTVGSIASSFSDLSHEVSVDLVACAVAELEAADLITADRAVGLSRRQLLKRFGVAAVVAPVVLSIAAPTLAAAQTGGVLCVAGGTVGCQVGGTGTLACCNGFTCRTTTNTTPAQGNKCCVTTGGSYGTGATCGSSNQCCSGVCISDKNSPLNNTCQ
jgi:hypothetical protein